jgi:hypothetical protein
MKANIKKQIAENNARIEFLQGQMEVYKRIQNRWSKNEITWLQFDELCKKTFKQDTCVDQNMRYEIEFLTKWNMILTGDVQMYANRRFYSDCDPYEIVEVKTPRMFVVRAMNCEHTGAPYENKWNITSDAKGHTLNVSIRKSKRGYNIAIVGEDGSGSHFGLSEHPHKYYDYEF